jgi:hypothetical protein
MGPPGWVVGPAVAIGTLLLLMGTPLAAIGIVGVILPPVIAMWVGAATASLIDARRHLNTTVVIITTLAVYLMVIGGLQSQGGGGAFMPAPPGAAKSGFNVPPP